MTTTAPAPISPTQTPDEQAEAAQAQLAAAAAAWSDPYYIKASATLALIALSKVANEVWNAAAAPTLRGRRCYLEEAAKRMEAVLPLLRPCPAHIIIREIDTNVNELVNLIESAQLSGLYELSEEPRALHLIAKIAVALIEEAPSAIINDSARVGLERIAESERREEHGEEAEMVALYLSEIDDGLDDESLGAIVGLHGAIEGRNLAVRWAELDDQSRDDLFDDAFNP